ncbi:MAG: hypothetical protein K8R86_08160 [Bacteroidales bacterium]|nr:hypothetical protein [Bacteroidales bacterium]
MKKLLKSLSILTVMFLFISCAAFQAKREVLPGNIFSTTNPSIMLKLDEGFYKTDGKSGYMFGNSAEGSMTSSEKREIFIWKHSNRNTWLYVVFSELPTNWFYYPNTVFDYDGYYNKKLEKLGNRQWRTALATVENGKYIAKTYVKYPSENSRIWIRYIERNYYKDLTIYENEMINKRADAAITFIR